MKIVGYCGTPDGDLCLSIYSKVYFEVYMTNVIKKVADKAIDQTCVSATPSEAKDFLYRIHAMLFEWNYNKV